MTDNLLGNEAEAFTDAMSELSKELGITIPAGEMFWSFGLKVWAYASAFAYSSAFEAVKGYDVTAAAILLGSKGGKKGGPARAATLTRARRIMIARNAARKRWATTP